MMQITQLIELNDKTHEALGWRGGGSIDLGYNVEEVGDLVMYFDVHDSLMTKYSDLLDAFSEIKLHLEALYGKYAAAINFFENEKSRSGYSVAILLAHFSTITHEKRSEG